jgi:hypothetical protein
MTCDDAFWAAAAALNADRRWRRRVHRQLRRQARRAALCHTALRWGLACRALSPMGVGAFEIQRAGDDPTLTAG